MDSEAASKLWFSSVMIQTWRERGTCAADLTAIEHTNPKSNSEYFRMHSPGPRWGKDRSIFRTRRGDKRMFFGAQKQSRACRRSGLSGSRLRKPVFRS